MVDIDIIEISRELSSDFKKNATLKKHKITDINPAINFKVNAVNNKSLESIFLSTKCLTRILSNPSDAKTANIPTKL